MTDRQNPSTRTALVVVVDTADPLGEPTALLRPPAAGPVVVGEPLTVLERLLARLATHGLTPTAVLTRSAWRDRVAVLVPAQVPVIAHFDTAGGLAALAAQVERGDGPIVVVAGDVLAHDGLIGDLVADQRLRSAVVVGAADGVVPTVRVAGDVLVEAGTDVTPLAAGNGVGVGLLRFDAADRQAASDVIWRLSGTAAVHNWATDITDLATLGAVQAGVALRVLPVGEYVCGRVTRYEQAAGLAARLGVVDEHRVRLRRVARPDDGFYSTFVVRRISPRFTDYAVRWGLTPNQITGIAFGVAMLAAWWFAAGGRVELVVGALLLQLSLVLDCVDGETARYTRRFTPLGAWLDATTDRVKEYVVYAALAVGASQHGHSAWTLAAATLALQVFRNFVDFGFVATLAERSGAGAGVGAAAIALSERTSGTALKWAKRMVFLPIGERWLLISLVAALAGPRAVFIVLLALGLVSAVYATTGRVLRTLAVRPGVEAAA
ncbi:MAG TPA: CDP-alcohol phosphatidyltransferase family protein [Sporichthyaceae bacterium]